MQEEGKYKTSDLNFHKSYKFLFQKLKKKLFGVLRNILKKWKWSCKLETSSSWCDPEKGVYDAGSKTSVSIMGGTH
jgi:hypothetical protein